MKKIFLLLFLLTAFLLRFWHGQDFFFWHVDEEILSLTAKRILVDHRIQLIGFPIPGGIYLGPLIYYIIAFIFALSFMNPLVLPFYSALLGTVTVYLVYKVGKIIFEDNEIGIVAAVLYAFSYLTNVYAHLLTGLTFGPILALLTYLLLYKIIKTGYQKYVFALGAVLVVASQNEGTSLSLIALVCLSWLFFRFKVKIRSLFFVGSALLLAQLPLLIFDLRHNYFLFHSFVNFFSSPAAKGKVPQFDIEILYKTFSILPQTMSRFLTVGGNLNVADQILPCVDLLALRLSAVSYPLVLACIFILACFIFISLKAKAPAGNKIVLYHLALIIFGILLFNIFVPGYFYEWMLVIFFPAIAYMLAIFLKHLKFLRPIRLTVVAIFLLLLAFGNLKSLFLTNGDFGLKNKTTAVALALKEVAGVPFALETMGSCYSQGYIYLFWQQGQLPVKSYADDMFSSTLNLNPNNIKPKKKVVMVNPSRFETQAFWDKYNKYAKQAKEKFRVGKIVVLITD